MLFHVGPEVTARIFKPDCLGAKTHQPRLAIGSSFQPERFTPEEYFCTQDPLGLAAWLDGLAQQLLLEPGHVSFGEPFCFSN